MMLKLSLTSIKKRWQDYLVLMMGLIIAISIFYMFQTLSLNTSFLEENIPTVSMVAIVFQFGAFLLAIITVVYIFYANSFLLSMRKKEYGMYMMLGAKKQKIGKMISIETLFIGSMSTVLGLVVGTVLAKVMGTVLSQLIDLPSNTYESFVPKALLITLAFFSLLFFITTLVNVREFKKTRTLDLLYSESQSEKSQRKLVVTILGVVLSLILLSVGYYMMINIMTFQLVGILVAILTITPGTFLFFGTVVPIIVKRLKNWEGVSHKSIRIFTLSQLSFKASALARVLGLVTMLLALSLGAVTVGQAFNHFAADLLKTNPYDLVIYDPTSEMSQEVTKLKATKEVTYHVKQDAEVTYFISEEIAENPLLVQNPGEFDGEFKELKGLEPHITYSMENDYQIATGFSQISNWYEDNSGKFQLVPRNEFEGLQGAETTASVIKVADYKKDAEIFKTIDGLEMARGTSNNGLGGKYQMYQQIQSMASGFMFMGFFLGLAFLAMLASCLMFKILTGAYQDIKRYEMLHKIGVRHQLLVNSIRKEILAVFLAPAFLGVIHVLIGLKMFTIFIPDPYAYIALPFVLYGCIYMLYYLVTVRLYKGIVLNNKS
ncbi:FtsX-like permease family protein [Vagococcus salmoninarum]|uniref:FtsX-like permease family protein n=1 Tax=Vagococcus salmoninarum TaxID=2739 RepID=UPI001881187D|nr:ABC transporter permease [Vagococcus salmoninarum]MBE9389278.1 ABC transporter permease [Vagococcus salmoninarum]